VSGVQSLGWGSPKHWGKVFSELQSDHNVTLTAQQLQNKNPIILSLIFTIRVKTRCSIKYSIKNNIKLVPNILKIGTNISIYYNESLLFSNLEKYLIKRNHRVTCWIKQLNLCLITSCIVSTKKGIKTRQYKSKEDEERESTRSIEYGAYPMCEDMCLFFNFTQIQLVFKQVRN